MPVQINISGENAGQAVEELVALSVHFASRNDAPAAPETPKQRTPRKTAEAPKPEKQAEPEIANDSDDIDQHLQHADGDAGSDEAVPTDVELRAAASAAGKRVGPDKVKGLLTKFNSANVTAVPNEKRAEFLIALEGLK